MIRLREKDIEKLSIILQLPQYTIEKMAAMNLINDSLAVDMLMVYDWKKLKNTKKYTVKQILQAIMDEYQVSKTVLLVILSFLIPIVGFVLYFVKKSDEPEVAKNYLWAGLAGFILGTFMTCV